MKQVSNFTMVDVSGLQANSNSFIIDVAGNCMNSDKSPMRAKDEELCGFFEHLDMIRVCCYVPQFQSWDIPLRRVKGFYIVDAVLSPEYIKSHTK
jgi:hypothetical protein